MRAGNPLSRPEWVILLSLLVAAPFLLTCWVHGDGIGYVAMLRAAVVQRNLDLDGEFEHLAANIRADASGLPARLLARSAHAPGIDPVFQTPQRDPVTGRVVANYSVGPPLAWAPLYLVAHAVTLLRDPEHATGYGGLYYLAIALSSLACGALGLWFAFRFARALVPGFEAGVAALAAVWATPLVYYLYLAPSYSHALTVLTSSAFFLHWWSTRGSHRPGVWFQRGLLAGLMFLAHWNDLVLALPVLVLEAARLWHGGKGSSDASASRHLLRCGFAAAAGLAIAAAPQLAVWQYFHGRPWVRHPADYVHFTAAGLWGTLLSNRHGLFVWTPASLVAAAGLLRLARRDTTLAAVCLSSLLLLVVSNCMVRDWWGGAAFGMRRMLSGTPLFVLGYAVLLADLRHALSRADPAFAARGPRGAGAGMAMGVAATVLLSIWNLLLLAQYALGMIPHSDPVRFSILVAQQPQVVSRLVQLAAELLH